MGVLRTSRAQRGPGRLSVSLSGSSRPKDVYYLGTCVLLSDVACLPTVSSQGARLIVDNFHALKQLSSDFDKIHVRGIVVDIIVSVLLAVEFNYEAVGKGRLFVGYQLGSRELLLRLQYRESLRTVVPTSRERRDVGLSRSCMNTVIFQGKHALTCLWERFSIMCSEAACWETYLLDFLLAYSRLELK